MFLLVCMFARSPYHWRLGQSQSLKFYTREVFSDMEDVRFNRFLIRQDIKSRRHVHVKSSNYQRNK